MVIFRSASHDMSHDLLEAPDLPQNVQDIKTLLIPNKYFNL